MLWHCKHEEVYSQNVRSIYYAVCVCARYTMERAQCSNTLAHFVPASLSNPRLQPQAMGLAAHSISAVYGRDHCTLRLYQANIKSKMLQHLQLLLPNGFRPILMCNSSLGPAKGFWPSPHPCRGPSKHRSWPCARFWNGRCWPPTASHLGMAFPQ